jgi:hypothetical protein
MEKSFSFRLLYEFIEFILIPNFFFASNLLKCPIYLAGPYFGYTYAPAYAQQLAAAGLPYAMTAAPAAGSAAGAGGQPQPGQQEARIQ